MSESYFPIPGHSFVCIGEGFAEVKLYRSYYNADDGNRLYGSYFVLASEGKEPSIIRKPIEECPGPYFPSLYSTRNGVEDVKAQYMLYSRISKKIDDLLLEKPGNANLISATINYLVEVGEQKDDAVTIIKTLLGENFFYKYKRLKSGEYIEFSQIKISAENVKRYYGSLADEIKVKSEKIGLLVSHGQTVGNYREYILRGLLKKYLPGKYNVATGFIEGLPQQLDIIIYDSFNHTPSFIEGDLVVVRREAVRAIIEVKTTLTSNSLHDALQLFYDISRPGIYFPEIPIFKGIFAFDTKFVNTSGLAESIKNFYTVPYFEEQLQKDFTRSILYLFHEITCVAALNKHCIFSRYISANGLNTDNVIPALVSISDQRETDIQTAMFLSLLFDFLDVDAVAKKSTSDAFGKIYRSITADLKLEAKLTQDDWFPQSHFNDGHDHSQESVRWRLSRIYKWLSGEMSTDSFLHPEIETNLPK